MPHARNLPQLLNDSVATQNHAQATEKLARQARSGQRQRPAIVIWPENSTNLDPFSYPAVYQEVSAAVNAIGRPVLVGEVLNNPQRNAGQLWLPDRGPTAIYVKRQLVRSVRSSPTAACCPTSRRCPACSLSTSPPVTGP